MGILKMTVRDFGHQNMNNHSSPVPDPDSGHHFDDKSTTHWPLNLIPVSDCYSPLEGVCFRSRTANSEFAVAAAVVVDWPQPPRQRVHIYCSSRDVRRRQRRTNGRRNDDATDARIWRLGVATRCLWLLQNCWTQVRRLRRIGEWQELRPQNVLRTVRSSFSREMSFCFSSISLRSLFCGARVELRTRTTTHLS